MQSCGGTTRAGHGDTVSLLGIFRECLQRTGPNFTVEWIIKSFHLWTPIIFGRIKSEMGKKQNPMKMRRDRSVPKCLSHYCQRIVFNWNEELTALNQIALSVNHTRLSPSDATDFNSNEMPLNAPIHDWVSTEQWARRRIWINEFTLSVFIQHFDAEAETRNWYSIRMHLNVSQIEF